MQNLKPIELPFHKRTRWFCTHVDISTGHIFCHLAEPSISVKYERLEEQISGWDKAGRLEKKAVQPSIGELVLAKYSEDWYRSQVTEIDFETKEVVVFFLDYGNTETILFSDLRELSSSFCNLPAHAVECVLAEIEPFTPSGSWNPKAIDLLKDLVLEQELPGIAVGLQRKNLVLKLYADQFAKVTVAEQLITAGFGKAKISKPSSSSNSSIVRSDSVSSISSGGSSKQSKHSSSSAKSLKSFKNMPLGKEQYINVCIVYSEGISKFFCQTTNFKTDIDNLQTKIQMLCNGNKLPVISNSKVNQICCAKYADDEMFYRGIIKAVQGNTCNVFFVDYGNSAVVPLSDIREVNKEVTRLPASAIECFLSGVTPTQGNEFSAQANEAFDQLTAEKNDLLALVHNIEKGGRVELIVYDYDETPVAEKLAKQNLVVLTESNNVSTNVSSAKSDSTSRSQEIVKIKYMSLDLAKNQQYSVYVSYIYNPHYFYVNPGNSTEAINKLMAELQVIYNSEKHTAVQTPEIGQPCVCKFIEDDQFYRCEIQSLDKNTANVLYVDYGNADKVSISEILPLRKEFIKLNKQAAPCRLSGVEPGKGDFSIEARETFENMVLDKNLTMYVHDIKDGVLQVSLKEVNENNEIATVDVGKALLVAGHAQQSLQQVPSADKYGNKVFSQDKIYSELQVEHDSFIDVVPVVIVDPGNFCCHLVRNVQPFKEMTSLLNEFYSKSQPELNFTWRKMMPCVALYEDDNCWYRATILAVTNESVEVVFVDFGNSANIKPNHLRAIHEYFMELPSQMFVCSLTDIQPIKGNWDDASSEAFEGLVFEKPLACHVKNRCTSSNVYSVMLYDTKVTPEVNVGQWLIEKKYASSTNQQEQKLCALYPSPEKNEKIVVTSVSGFTEFYVQLIRLGPELDILMDSIHNYYSAIDQSDLAISNPIIGQFCCATFSQDQGFYRAKIEEVEGSNLSVFYCDYGNAESLNVNSVKLLTPSFEASRAFAIPCKLSGVDQLGNASQLEIISDKEFDAVFISNEAPYEVELMLNGKSINEDVKAMFGVKKSEVVIPSANIGSTNVDTYMLEAYSVKRFYCQLVSEEAKLNELMEAIANYVESSEFSPGKTNGRYCLAKYAADGGWYRAEILEHVGEKVRVFYCDYGNEDTIDGNMVSAIPKTLASLQQQAVPCSLSGLPTTVDENSFLEAFNSKCKDEIVSVQVVGQTSDGFSLVEVCLNGTNVIDLLCPNSTNESESCNKTEEATAVSLKPSDVQVNNAELGVCYVIETADTIKCQLSKYQQDLDTLMVDIEARATSLALLSKPNIGDLCIAKYVEDEGWYRGCIQSIDNDFVNVDFVDYGNSDRVSIGDVKKMPKDFTSLPQCCLTVVLHDVHIADLDEKQAKSHLEKILDKSLKIEIMEVLSPNKVSAYVYEESSEYHVNDILYEVAALEESNEVIDDVTKDDVVKSDANKTDVVKSDTDKTDVVKSDGNKTDIVKSDANKADVVKNDTNNTDVVKSDINKTDVVKSDANKTDIVKEEKDEDETISAYTIPSIGSKETVFCTFIPDSPDSFEVMVQLKAYEDLVNEIMEKTSSIAATVPLLQNIATGTPCLAQYSVDNEWYRGLVQAIESNLATVYFVDFGNVEKVNVGQVKSITKDLLNVPITCVKCLLHDVHVEDFDKPKVQAWLETQMQDQVLMLEVQSKEENTCPIQISAYVYIAEATVDGGHVNDQIYELFAEPESSETINEQVKEENQVKEVNQVESTPKIEEVKETSIELVQEIDQEQTPEIFPNDRNPEENSNLVIDMPQLSVGTTENCMCFVVTSATEIRCQLSKYETELDTLMIELATEGNSGKFLSLDNPIKGNFCIAKYSVDEGWYRGYIREVESKGCSVEFIDFGNTETVLKEDIKQISSKYTDLCQTCVAVILHDVHLEDLDEIATKAFLDGKLEHTVRAEIVEILGEAMISAYVYDEGRAEHINDQIYEYYALPVAEEVLVSDPVAEVVLESNQVAEEVLESAPVAEEVVELAPVAEEVAESAPVVEQNTDMIPTQPPDSTQNEIANENTVDEGATASSILTESENKDSPTTNVKLTIQKPSLSVGGKENAFCTFVESAIVLKCQLSKYESEIENLQVILTAHAANNTIPETVSVGDFCVAKYSLDNCWYRAQVTKENSPDISVEFIDYGNNDIVKISELRSMTVEIAELPRTCIDVQLHDVHVTDIDITKAKEWLESSVIDQLVSLDIVSVENDIIAAYVLLGAEVVNDKLYELFENSIESAVPEESNKESVTPDNALSQQEVLVTNEQSAPGEISENKSTPLNSATDDLPPKIELDEQLPTETSSEEQSMKPVPEAAENIASTEEAPPVAKAITYPKYLQSSDKSYDGVMTCTFVDPTEFILWCRPSKYDAYVEQVSLILSREPDAATRFVNFNELSVGNAVISQSQYDDIWYRTEVIEITSKNEIKVRHVDFGSTETVSIERISTISDETLLAEPATCYAVILKDVSDTDINAEKSKAWLQEKLEEASITITLEATDKESEELSAYVYFANNEAISINYQLYELFSIESASVEPAIAEEVTSPKGNDGDYEGYVTPKLSVGTSEKAFCTIIDSPTVIRCQLSKFSNELETLMEHIASVGDSLECLATLKEGQSCIAPFHQDLALYRARIVSVSDATSKVEFVDYGNIDDVINEDFKEIQKEMLAKPIFCVTCQLSDITVLPEHEQEAVEYLNRTLVESGDELSILINDVKDSRHYVTVFHNNIDLNKHMKEEFGDWETIYRPPDIKLGDKINVQIPVVDSLGNFWCQIKDHSEKLGNLMKSLSTSYEIEKEPLSDFTIGMPCCARNESNNTYYRAVIEKDLETDLLVRYIDYGVVESIPKSDAFLLQSRFFKLPTQTFQACLFDLQPTNESSSFTEEAVNFFNEKCRSITLSATIVSRSGENFAVALVLPNGDTIYELLTEMQLAKPGNQLSNPENAPVMQNGH